MKITPLIQLNRIQVGYDGKQVMLEIDMTEYKHGFIRVIDQNEEG